MRTRGLRIDHRMPDILIAGTVLTYGLIMVPSDTDFDDIPGLIGSLLPAGVPCSRTGDGGAPVIIREAGMAALPQYFPGGTKLPLCHLPNDMMDVPSMCTPAFDAADDGLTARITSRRLVAHQGHVDAGDVVEHGLDAHPDRDGLGRDVDDAHASRQPE